MIGDTQFPQFSPRIPSPASADLPLLPNQELVDPDLFVADVLLLNQNTDSIRIPRKSGAGSAASGEDDPSVSDNRKNNGTDDEGEPAESVDVPENAIKMTILHTNDIHGAVDRLPALTGTINKLKKEDPQAVLVDSGDLAYSAKPPESEGDQFNTIIDYLNGNNYMAIVPGNHDFQWGKEAASTEFFGKLKADVLCANIFDPDTGKLIPNTKPYVIKDIQGVKVAIVGVTTTKMQTNEHPEIGQDLIALDDIGVLQREIALARNEGAQVFIALIHKGITTLKDFKMLAQKLPDLDLMVIAHDHKVEKRSYRTGSYPHRTYIVESGQYGANVGKVDLFIDRETKKVLTAHMKTIPAATYENAG